MNRPIRIALLMPVCAMALSACTNASELPSFLRRDPPLQKATIVPDPPQIVHTVQIVQPLPLPGQLQPKPRPVAHVTRPPKKSVEAANLAALQEPTSDGYINAIQIYPYSEGALYRLYAAPQEVSDIALQPGENLTAISAGDTTRWVVGDTTSGSGATKEVHILAKPFAANLRTNLIITTDRRTYHLQLESTGRTYMAAISWTYPQDGLVTENAGAGTVASHLPTDNIPALDNLNFNYEISGDHPPWKPMRAFDDGTHVYIEFPKALDQGEAPPLFVAGPGGSSDLVNYRVRGNYYIVDQLFKTAELRLGQDHQQVVRIKRTNDLRTADTNGNQQSR
ncbi:MAG: P-type conjugative transfer protein TrbG [Alphaproteobacteria bacterium]|nr:P-type conjugative transfer protein TrbG [Alphaproteobacteria bacterium]MDE2631364.1 P-type conjugative transfer protein TrbG [Alphaproteobacteria bacterium]